MTTLDSIFSKPDTAIDPVCKMEVDMTKPPGGMAEHQAETYYFCSAGCRHNFESAPGKYLSPGHDGTHEHMRH